MKTKQVNPMPAFVGTPENPCDFDCELSGDVDFRNSIIAILANIVPESMNVGTLYGANTNLGDWEYCRPRLNKPQVLPDWGWLDNPLLDGFVWEVAQPTHKGINKKILVTASFLKMHISRDSYEIAYASISGVQKGSQLEDWAIENDVPIYNDDMEVVK